MDMDLDSLGGEDFPADIGHDPPPGPRAAAAQGEQSRRASAGDDEFRRPSEDPAFGTQSKAKKQQAKDLRFID
jgi:hypothetical protein